MSTGQLLLTMLIALLVFGPNKLPMLANHLGRFIARLDHYKQQANSLWQIHLNEQLLQENQRKAREADAFYDNGLQTFSRSVGGAKEERRDVSKPIYETSSEVSTSRANSF